jgi:hypothetical protein
MPMADEIAHIAKRPPWLDDIVIPLWRTCRQRILIVTDGSLDYNETNDFGLTEFLNAIETSNPYGLTPVISIAHRTNNPALASATMKAKFTFYPGFQFEDGTAGHALMNNTTRRFDQLWLFGISSNPISDAEVRVIASFMGAGGGVFATGDHDTLGSGMSARLPRIRKMREWAGVPMGGADRIDTVNEPGGDNFWEFRDQSDDIPQRIFPHFTQDSLGDYRPHALLRRPGITSYHDVIDVLPDHPHESECYVGTDLADPYSLVSGVDTNEFPLLPSSTTRLSPEIIATSMSGGRIVEKGPVAPRSFGAISVYDGHQVSRGRIVCDATWHHFVNINLDGTGTTRAGLKGTGMTPTLAYEKVTQYFRNTAEWLGVRRRCHPFFELAVERFKFPLLEEIQRVPKKPEFAELREVGRRVTAALQTSGGRGKPGDLVEELLSGAPEPFQRALGARSFKADEALVPTSDMAFVTLGSVAIAVFDELPENPWDMSKRFDSEKVMHDIADRAVAVGIERAIAASRQYLEKAGKQAMALAKDLGRQPNNRLQEYHYSQTEAH